MATITAAAGGGNWNATGTWAGGVVPTAADDVQLDATSGNVTINAAAVCRSLDCTGYTGTLTHNSATTLSIGDATAGAGNVALKLVSGMTYTLGNAGTSAISFISTSTTQQTITTGGKVLGNWHINGSNSSYILMDANSTGTAATVSMTNGTLNTNNQTCTWGQFNSNNSGFRTLTLGSSSITITANNAIWQCSNSFNFTLNAGTSTITFTGTGASMNNGNAGNQRTYYDLVFTGGGNMSYVSAGNATLHALTVTGTASKLDTFSLGAPITVTGGITFTGNSITQRLLVLSLTPGTQRTITNTGATVTAANVDFRDIAFSVSTDLSAITGGSGDSGGNAGIVFTPAATQTWSGNVGGAWTNNAWSGRIPLPQDDVIVNAAFAGGTVSADMARLGNNIDWTGVSGNPTFNFGSNPTTIGGSLTLAPGMTVAGNQGLTFVGRSSHSITSAGKQLTMSTTFTVPGGTYILQDAFSTSSTITLNNGTLNTNNQTVTAFNFSSNNSNTRSIILGSSSVTLTGTGNSWDTGTTTNMTINAGTSTITLTGSSTNFWSNGGTYYHLVMSGGGANVFLAGTSKTFNTLTVAGSPLTTGSNTTVGTLIINAGKTLNITSGTTVTVTSRLISNGVAGNLAVIKSTTTGSIGTLSKSSGIISTDYLSIRDSTATGGATWYAGANSINVANNTGWLFMAGPNTLEGGLGMMGMG